MSGDDWGALLQNSGSTVEGGTIADADVSGASEAPDLDGKVFVLGVGAQRSGTSWLHAYLASHACVCMSEIKEMNYFNALWSETHRRYAYNMFTSELKRLESGISRTGLRLPPEVATQGVRALRDRVAIFAGGDGAYVDFFRRRVAPHHTHFGEITPAYSLLPVESFRHIRSLFANIKVVFVLRDPVQRVYSALRWRHGPKADEALVAALSDPMIIERTRYDITIANLRAVFPAEALFFGFYETLFCDTSIQSLCEFLGLPFKTADYGQQVNASASQQRMSLTTGQIEAGRSAFAETYVFCRREFGDAVPASWHG